MNTMMNSTGKVAVKDWKTLKNRYRFHKEDEDEEIESALLTPFEAQRAIKIDGNHIYFYDEIDSETQLIFARMLEKAQRYLMQKYQDIIPMTEGVIPEGIMVHINSLGGDAISSFAIYDMIRESKVPVFGQVEGIAASGATIMLCACERRMMTKNSSILCHELRSWTVGKWSELKDAHENSVRTMEKIIQIYSDHTKIPSRDIEKILEHDIYWDKDECLKFGLVDEVIGYEPQKPKKKKTAPKKAKAEPKAEVEEKAPAKEKKSSKKTEKTVKKVTEEEADDNPPDWLTNDH